MVFAEDAERLLPLHQCEEVVCHGLTIEEVVHTQEEVPAWGEGNVLTASSLRQTFSMPAEKYVQLADCRKDGRRVATPTNKGEAKISAEKGHSCGPAPMSP